MQDVMLDNIEVNKNQSVRQIQEETFSNRTFTIQCAKYGRFLSYLAHWVTKPTPDLSRTFPILYENVYCSTKVFTSTIEYGSM